MAGYFVDWDGKTRSVDTPGFGLTCSQAIERGEVGKPSWKSLFVIGSDGGVIYEAVYYQTLEAIKAVGVVVDLINIEECHA